MSPRWETAVKMVTGKRLKNSNEVRKKTTARDWGLTLEQRGTLRGGARG